AVCIPLVPLSTAIDSNSSCSASCSTSASRSSESSSTIRILRVFVIPRPQDRHHPGTALARKFGRKRASRLLRADEISCHGRHPIKLTVGQRYGDVSALDKAPSPQATAESGQGARPFRG